MSDQNLNERSAKCMGLEIFENWDGVFKKHGNQKEYAFFIRAIGGHLILLRPDTDLAWVPTEDANATRELLLEVERRGKMGDFLLQIADEWTGNSTSAWFHAWLLTAPLEVIVRAAVEVLEDK